MRNCIVVALVLTVFGSVLVSAGPAQDVLEDLASEERRARYVSGFTSVGVGSAVGIASLVFLADSDLAAVGLITGGLIAAPGVLVLALPSQAEREFSQAGGSEADAASALERLADTGRRERIVSGVVNTAAGVASLLYPYGYLTKYDYVYSAVSSFGMAAVDFLFPSKEEMAYARYRELAGLNEG